jgi:hypothetical protein
VALIKADRVKETSTSTGTGTIALAGAATGYRAFSAVCAVGDTLYYAIAHQTAGEWEVGLATYSAANTLTRTTVHASSNANAAVNFSAGTKDVFLSVTKAWLDAFLTTTSGTLNYVPKTTGTGTIGDSQIYDNGTSVGIGTSNPLSYVKIQSAVASNSQYAFFGQNAAGKNIVGLYSDGTGSGKIYVGDSSGTWQSLISASSGESSWILGALGVGNNSPGAQLQVTTAAAATKGLIVKAASGQSASVLELQNSAGTVAYSVNYNAAGIGHTTLAPGANQNAFHYAYSGPTTSYAYCGFGYQAVAGTTGYSATGAYLSGYNGTLYLHTASNNDIAFVPYNTEQMRITASGLVGIGTASSLGGIFTPLHVNAVSSYGAIMASQATATVVANSGGEIQFASTYRTTFGGGDLTQVARIRGLRENATANNWAGYLAFYTSTGSDSPSASTERLRIDSSGNVGIGISSPNDGLHVYNKTIGIATPSTSNDTVAFRIYRNSSTTQQFAIKTSYGAAWNTEIDSSNSDLWLRTTNAGGTGGNLVINADKVGINASATPGAALHVVNTAAATKALIVRGASGQSANLQEWQDSSGTVLAQISSSGSAVFGAQTGAQTGSVLRAWSTPSNALNGQILTSLTGATGASERFRMSIGNTSGYGFLQSYENAIGQTMGLALQPLGGNVHVGGTSPGAKLQVDTGAAATKGFIVRAASGQSANLQEWQNNGGTWLAAIDASGNFYSPAVISDSIQNTNGVGYYREYYITRTLPDTVGDYVELLEYAHTVGTRFKIDVMVADYPYWDNSSYEIGVAWDGVNAVIPPKFRYHRNTSDFVLEKYHGQTNPYTSRLRVKRTGAKSHTASSTVRVRVEAWATSVGGFPTDASATGTSTLGSGYTTDQSFCNPVLQAPPPVPSGNGSSISLMPSDYATSGTGGSTIVYGTSNSDGSEPPVLWLAGKQTSSTTISAQMLYSHLRSGNNAHFSIHSTYRMLRALPDTVGNYIELFSTGWSSRPYYRIIIATDKNGWSAGGLVNVYEFNSQAINNNNCVIAPTKAYGYDGNEYVLEQAVVTGVSNTFRLRRSAGSTTGINAYVYIEAYNDANFTVKSGTGTSTIGGSYWDTGLAAISVSSPKPVGTSGNGNNLSLYASSALTSGHGGSINFYAGAQAGSGNTGGVFTFRTQQDQYARNTRFLLVRSIPDAVGDYVELGRIGWMHGTLTKVSVFASRGGYDGTNATYNTLCKEYEFYSHYYSHGVVAPRSISGNQIGGRQPNEFELELAWNGNGYQVLRLRRTKADATNYSGYTAAIVIEQNVYSPHAMDFAETSGTGTSTLGSGYLTNTGNYCSPALYPPPPSGTSGAGTDLGIYAQSAIGTGNGGSILLQAGAYATSGSNGKVIVRGLASNTASLQEWQNNAGTSLASIESTGRLVSTGALIYNQSASVPTLQVRSGNPSTTSIQQWQNYYGTVLASVDASGNFNTPNLYASTVWSSQWFDGGPYVFSRIFTRNGNLPSVVGDYIELFECAKNRRSPIKILINSNDPYGNNQGRIYDIIFDDIFSGGSGGVVVPTYSGGDSYSNDFVLEIAHIDPYTSRFRLRRTAGTINRAFQAYINIQVGNTGADSVVLKYGTGTSTIGGNEYGNNPISTSWIRAQNTSAYSGAGRSITISAADGLTSGAGGDIILQGGAQASTGGNGKVIVRGKPSNTTNLQEWQNNSGTALAYVYSNGAIYAPNFTVAANAGLFYVGGRVGIGVGSAVVFGCEYTNHMRPVISSGFPEAGSSYAGTIINTNATYTSTKLLAIQNNGTSKVVISHDGDIQTTGSIQITSNTPAAFTADQNNLALTASGFQRLSGTAARTITGIAPPSGASHVDGRMMRIYNVGSYNITLKHNSTSSSIANRFCCVQAIDIVLGPRDFAELIYDGTDGGLVSGQNNPCWRVA